MAIVAISRGTFTGGQALAECLAQRLGYQCVSREVVLDAASSFGIPVERFIEAMEKPPSFWERLTGERADYLNYLQASLCEYAASGDLVFHGYAGHLLIPGVSHVVRVRAIADVEDRIRTAIARHGLDRKDAIGMVRRVDRERAEWTRFLFGIDWQDPLGYDVVVNISRLGIDGACNVVARTVDLDPFRPTTESRQAMEDLRLSSRVWVALAGNSMTGGASLKVEAKHGFVSITGSALTWDVVESISQVALQVPGVRDVRTDVRVNPMYSTPI